MNTSSFPTNEAAARASIKAIAGGLCASLVGIGLARFAYTPLIPSLIEAHWFSVSDVIYLGAANLMGYLVGALMGRPLARHVSASTVLRLMMLLASAAFLPVPFRCRSAGFLSGDSCRVWLAAALWCWWHRLYCRTYPSIARG